MYNPAWRKEDEGRLIWLEKLYRLDGRHHDVHPKAGTYSGLVDKYGAMPWR